MFTGVGGFELGFKKSNNEFECVGFSEIDKYACQVLKYQSPEIKNYGDATKIIYNINDNKIMRGDIKIVGYDNNVAWEVTSSDKYYCKNCKKKERLSLEITFLDLKKALKDSKSNIIKINSKGYCKKCNELIDDKAIIPLSRKESIDLYKKLEKLSKEVSKLKV